LATKSLELEQSSETKQQRLSLSLIFQHIRKEEHVGDHNLNPNTLFQPQPSSFPALNNNQSHTLTLFFKITLQTPSSCQAQSQYQQ
jgi:hypothetical protein